MNPPNYQQLSLILVLAGALSGSAGAAPDGAVGLNVAAPWMVYNASIGQVSDLVSTRDSDGPRGNAATLDWWEDAKFGFFINWGPSSLTGKEIGWSRAGDRPGVSGGLPGDIPVEEYDNLYRKFNPTEFNARDWVATAAKAGMKYIVFDTKHHDGFCMYDSKLTDYDITQSPFKRDVTAELAEVCHEEGMGLGLYYSLPDWHHPDYRTGNHDRFIEYLHGQVREICTNYGTVDILWFDGKLQGTAETWDTAALIPMIRELQPKILINDRAWGDDWDFYTPEQVIGRYDPMHPWESCITLGQQWSWKPNDDIKPWQECVRLMVLTVGGGGNFLLNVAPMPNGAFEPRQVKVLDDIGIWMEKFGEAIYETRPGPFPPSYWGASTQKGNVIYLHIFKGWESGLELPLLEREIVSARSLQGDELEIDQREDHITIDVKPKTGNAAPVSVLALTLDGPANGVSPKETNVGIPAGAVARAPNVRREEPGYAPSNAVDDDPKSRWATDDGIRQTWLEIDLPYPITFDVMLMDEAFGERIESFRLQCREKNQWKTFHEGAKVGRNWAAKFDPVTAQHLRLKILSASDGPTIRDIRFHILGAP